MDTQLYEGRLILTERINQQLGSLTQTMQLNVKNNMNSYNVTAETILAGLLNRIHGWHLVNANTVRQNFPAVDLIDPDAGIAVQVTTTNTLQKLDHTLTQFTENGLGSRYRRLIFLAVTTNGPTAAMQARTLNGCFRGGEDLWNTATLSSQIQALTDIGRLEDIAGYLTREVGSYQARLSRPHLYLPLRSALGDGFVGRETELANIARQLDAGMRPVVLSGLGGMGKTELAVQFGREYRGGSVYFVRFGGSFTATVTGMFSAIRPQPEAFPGEQIQYETVLSLLEALDPKDLLIIDNVDADGGSLEALMADPAWQDLLARPMGLLLTTRFDKARAVDVGSMPNGTLYEIFHNHGAQPEQEQMDALIGAVSGHTLTIDLMARLLNGSGWRAVTPEMLLTAIRENTLPAETYRKITSDYGQSPSLARIYQHLRAVFDVSGVPEVSRNVLRCAALLPAGGMTGGYFGDSLTGAEQDALDELLSHGWLTMEKGLLTIHPVIRLVCREELKPREKTCGAFLKKLWQQFDRTEYDRVKFAQLAETFALAAETLADPEGEWLNRSGCLWNELDQYQQAAELYEAHLPALEQRLPDHPSLATAYNNLGYACGTLGDHKRALEFQMKAMEIREQVLLPNHPALALSYNNVGSTYGYLGDHKRALEFKIKALEIREQALPPNHPDLAASYNNVGLTYGDLGDHKRALEFMMKALEIWEQALPPHHPDLATSYNNVGATYGDLGDHKRALEFKMKALKIQEQVLPPNHPDLATSYNNVGLTYGDLGDHKRALEFQMKDLDICKQVLPPNHPDLATSYNNVGLTYWEMGKPSKALPFVRQALAIREAALPEGHPDIAVSRESVQFLEQQLQTPKKKPFWRRFFK